MKLNSVRIGYLLNTTILTGLVGAGLLTATPGFTQTAVQSNSVQNQVSEEDKTAPKRKEQVLQLDTITISPTI